MALMVGLVTSILSGITAPLLSEVVDDHSPDLRRRDFLIPVRLGGRGRRGADRRRTVRREGGGRRAGTSAAPAPMRAQRGTRGCGPSRSPGIQPWRTPNSDFYLIHTALAPPSISPPDWQLRIHGMVEQELTFGYQDLTHRPPAGRGPSTPCAASRTRSVGVPIGNAYWSGVLARELLAEAGVKPRRRCGAADLRMTDWSTAVRRSRRSPMTATRCWPSP